MDPLSVTASIVGILAAAAKIYELLHTVVSSAKEAPYVVTALMVEVDHVRSAFESLQSLLLDLSSAPPRRTAMVQVDRLIVTLTETVLTLSELETIVAPLVVPQGQRFTLRTRLKWTRTEGDCARMVEKLQRHKLSVSLMLNVFQCTSDAEAARAQASLGILVEQLLQTNRGLCKRMRNLEDAFDARSIRTNNQSDAPSLMSHGDSATIATARRRKRNRTSIVETFRIRFAFDDDLESSRVYNRVMLRNSSDRSFNSSAVRTNAWSVFSGLSLADISIISVVALPIYASDIRNQEHYLFGDAQAMQPFKKSGRENGIAPAQSLAQDKYARDQTGWWKRVAQADSTRSQSQQTSNSPPSSFYPAQKTVEEISPHESVSGRVSPSNSSVLQFTDEISPDESISGPPSPFSGPVMPEDARLKELLPEVIDAQQILDEDSRKEINNNPIEHEVILSTKNASTSLWKPMVRNTVRRSPCPICSGGYLKEGQILALAGTERHDGCRMCSECGEPLEWIAQVVLDKRGMPALICTVCIGNLLTATMINIKTMTNNKLVIGSIVEPAIESIIEPTIDLAIELTNETVNVEGIGLNTDGQSYRRRTWDGSSHNTLGRREAQFKRSLDDLDVVSGSANMETNRSLLDNDCNFWHDERFPNAQTWKGKVKKTPKNQVGLEIDLALKQACARRNTRDHLEMDLPLVEENAQGTIEEHQEIGMPSTEQHTQRALSLFDFSFGWEERARSMLEKQEISENNLSLIMLRILLTMSISDQRMAQDG